MEIKTPNIFNPSGNDSKEYRKIWKGDSTNIIQLNNVNFTWAVRTYKQMLEDFWIPQKVNLTQDAVDYNLLTNSEKRAYNGIVSYLTFLDSIQVSNLGHIQSPLSAPEIKICLSQQQSQESVHSFSYQTLIESIVPAENRNDIYDFWRTDKILEDRCRYIATLYQKYIDSKSEEDYFVALLANFLLEGLYFFTGFNFFFSLASRNLMRGSADMIAYIKRNLNCAII